MTDPLPNIRISVALVTRNRPASLERCLQSWSLQTVAPFEIVVSDDSDGTHAPKIVELARHYGCVYTQGPRRGLYANRNHASLSCRGTHILSADDDHTHPPGLIHTITQAIQNDSDAIWTVGERHPKRPDVPHSSPCELRTDGTVGPPVQFDHSAAIACGSTAYPRGIFDHGFRYNEAYRFGGIWYLWGHQLRKAGFKIRWCPDTFVWHHSETWMEWGNDNDTLKTKTEADLFSHWSVARILGYPPRFALRLATSTIRSVTLGTPQTPERRPVRIPLQSALRAIRRSMNDWAPGKV